MAAKRRQPHPAVIRAAIAAKDALMPDPTPNPDPKPVADPKPAEPEKLTLTREELKAQIDSALKAERDKTAKEREKDKDEAERKKAEEAGEFQKLAEKERAKREEAEASAAALRVDLKRAEVRESVRDYLATNHAAYLGTEKYIIPLIAFDGDTKPEDVAKSVKAAAEQYVKDNPRAKGGAGITADGRSGAHGNHPPRTNPNNRHAYVGPAASTF
jgi:hypothetical protein